MRNLTRFSAVLTACLALGTAACGDDGGDPATTTSADTTTTPSDTTATTTEVTNPSETTGDVDDDLCDPNPCTTPPGPVCDGNSVVTSTGGTCAEVGTSFTCTYTETPVACTGTDVCAGGACVAGGDKCDYTFDAKVSYVTSIALGNQEEKNGDGVIPDECCFDFTGDGKVDNKLGGILGSVAGIAPDFDINGTIVEQIAEGSLVLLLETKGLESATADTDVDIAGFYGEDADADLTNNATGMSSFTVNPSSFLAGTATPIISFPDASITGGVLAAGPSIFQLSVPIAGAQLDLAVSDTRLQATVATGANGQGLKMDGGAVTYGAKLGGVIKKIDLINALNAYIGTCDCLVFKNGATQMISVTGNNATCAQVDTTNSTCGEDDGACGQIPTYCSILLGFLSPDVDTDEDGLTNSINDGISVGVWIKAESAAISGIDTCPAE